MANTIKMSSKAMTANPQGGIPEVSLFNHRMTTLYIGCATFIFLFVVSQILRALRRSHQVAHMLMNWIS